jgi:hypothetical protein
MKNQNEGKVKKGIFASIMAATIAMFAVTKAKKSSEFSENISYKKSGYSINFKDKKRHLNKKRNGKALRYKHRRAA